MKDKLLSQVGEKVTVSNVAFNDMDGAKIGINFAGALEYSEDEDSFYLRVAEDYFAGSMGICFRANHVSHLANRPSNGELWITLK